VRDISERVNDRLRAQVAGPEGDEVYLFHGTASKPGQRVLRDGLMPLRARGPVYLTADIQAAAFYAGMWTAHYMSRHGARDEAMILCFSVPAGDLERVPHKWDSTDEFIVYGGLPITRLAWHEAGALGIDLSRPDFQRATEYVNARMDAGAFGTRCPEGCSKGVPRYATDVALSVATRHARASEIHGLAHWGRVAVLAAHLVGREPDADRGVVEWFSLLHDTQRVNDGHDPEHGPRAAAVARTIKALQAYDDPDDTQQLDAGQLDKLCTALAGHTDGTTTDDPTTAVCWDADRLDLWRLGVEPDPRFLSTATARDPETIEFARDLQSMPIDEWVAATQRISGS
jgi:uncharacterized protein